MSLEQQYWICEITRSKHAGTEPLYKTDLKGKIYHRRHLEEEFIPAGTIPRKAIPFRKELEGILEEEKRREELENEPRAIQGSMSLQVVITQDFKLFYFYIPIHWSISFATCMRFFIFSSRSFFNSSTTTCKLSSRRKYLPRERMQIPASISLFR